MAFASRLLVPKLKDHLQRRVVSVASHPSCERGWRAEPPTGVRQSARILLILLIIVLKLAKYASVDTSIESREERQNTAAIQ